MNDPHPQPPTDAELFYQLELPKGTEHSGSHDRQPELLNLVAGTRIMAHPNTGWLLAILGAQKGDEGKGKIVAWAVKVLKALLTIRFQGGGNAGHQITLPDGKQMSFHHIPEGLAFGGFSAIGGGCVMHPVKMTAEIQKLLAACLPVGPAHLFIDPRVAVSTRYEMRAAKVVDGGGNSIGSTQSCIAETYQAIAGKYQVTVWDCVNSRNDYELLRKAIARNRRGYEDRIWISEVDFEATFEELKVFGQMLLNYARICRVDYLMQEWQRSGRDAVLVGGQGAHLDVISSRPTATSSHIWPPTGLGPCDHVLRVGIAKLFPTCAGHHVVPTIVEGEEIDKLRVARGEFGKTSGRPYTLYVPFIAQLAESVRRLGLDVLIINKADLDTGPVTIKTDLRIDGVPVPWWASELEMWDPSQSGEASARISFGNSFELPEIEGRVAGIRNWDDLPETLRDRCQTIDALLRGAHAPHCRVRGIGNGPRPEDVVIRTRA